MRHAIFIVNLLQDVNIVRPLAYLAAHELGQTVAFLVSDKFLDRDTTSSWERELRIIAAATNAEIYVYDSEFRAYDFLQGKGGVLVAGSESSLSAHAAVHNVFRIAPSSFLKITLQHGLECVGFLQNREHNLAHGRNVTFGADVVAGWCDPSILRSLAPSQQAKLCVTGPSALVPTPGAPRPSGQDEAVGGIICENLHSVRLNISGNFKASFMDTFFAFCERLGAVGDRATLRPHPGGQYVLKNNVPLPDNVVLNNRPMYDVDLSRYAYGISAPSSVLVDMVLAGIPTAVWQDDDEVMDIGNYAGLAVISTLEDWLAFERDARLRPGMLLDQQARFLERLKMPTDPVVVRDRFARLLSGGAQRLGTVARAPAKPQRVLFVANGFIPTLQLSFLKPLAAMGEGEVVWSPLYEEALRENLGQEDFNGPVGEAAALAHFREFDPDLVVFCRYSGPHSRALCDFARERGVPTIYHVDDDLLNIPREIGQRKFRAHNRPERLASVHALLSSVDLLYCSTPPLLRQFRKLGFQTSAAAGKIYCSGEVLSPAVERPVTKIGYMGFDHAHDLEMVLPAVEEVLDRNPSVTFELFGSIPKPASLDRFGDRVTVIPPVRVYSEFMQRFAELEWDIGICPLAPTAFNVLKANTKWVEYTSVGAAVIASRDMIYDDCCSDGCGDLATTHEEWVAAMEALCADAALRHRRVTAAQARLTKEYALDRLVDQVRDAFRLAGEYARDPGLRPAPPPRLKTPKPKSADLV